METAPAVARTDRTLELLVEANQAILGELSLSAVLQRIVVSARELVEARYAALGVVGPDGGLEEFVHVGMDDALAAQIDHLPRGRGLLGALVEAPEALRIERIGDDHRSSGFPDHHPPMESFLGVPITVRGTAYGNLYLTDRAGGGPFTAEDEATLAALAVTAGIAIDNARLFEESQRRHLWAEGASAISHVLLDPRSGTDPVGLVAETLLRLSGADLVTLVVPDGASMLRVSLSRGVGAEQLMGLRYARADSIAGRALDSGRGVRVSVAREREGFAPHLQHVVDVGPVMALPLLGSLRSHGALIVSRLRGRPMFDVGELGLSESFAAQAAVALELAQARADQQRLVVLEDRERIARDLHDHVIQRLFASGLMLEGLAPTLPEGAARRVGTVVDDLDETIRQIRTLIFKLQSASTEGLRARVLDVVAEATAVLGFDPDVVFTGPVDTLVDAQLVDDVVAVVREGLSNVVRHARAVRAAVEVSATGSRLTVVLRDDGRGRGASARRSGLDNLERRARRHGGCCVLEPGPDGGTELRWTIPLR